MQNFKKVIREINRSIGFLLFFDTLLSTIAFFLIVYLLLSMINLYPLSAAIPAAVFFIARIMIQSRIDKKRMVEKEYIPLREKLRTAADSMNEVANPVVEELQEEVLFDLKNVSLSSFFDTKKVALRIFFIMMLSFAIVFTTTFNFYIVDVNKLIASVPDLVHKGGANKLTKPIGEINETDDIYGDSKLAVLGEEQIDIRIQPVNFEVSVRDEGDMEQKNFDERFPSDANVEQASAYEEYIPEEEQELVKNYFNELSK